MARGTLLSSEHLPLYSASTELVLSLGGGNVAMGFTLDPSRRDFVLSRPALECPSRGPYSSHVERAAVVAPRLTTLASWGWLVGLLGTRDKQLAAPLRAQAKATARPSEARPKPPTMRPSTRTGITLSMMPASPIGPRGCAGG